MKKFALVLLLALASSSEGKAAESFECIGGQVTDVRGVTEEVGFFVLSPAYAYPHMYRAHFTTRGGRVSNWFRGSFTSYAKNPNADTDLLADTTFADTVNGKPVLTHDITLKAIRDASGAHIVTHIEYLIEENKTYTTTFNFSPGTCSWK